MTTEGSPPLRLVMAGEFADGPRGGQIAVMHLECGHVVWRNTKTPPRRVRCISCWLEGRKETQ